jgi:hypothetical protein
MEEVKELSFVSSKLSNPKIEGFSCVSKVA